MEKLLDTCDPQSLKQNPNNAGGPLSKLVNVYLKPIIQIAIHSG